MQSNTTFNLSLPKLGGTENVLSTGQIVIIGANGAGKTKLGAWIEQNFATPQNVHRVSAQKSLTMPDQFQIQNPNTSLQHLLFGHPNGNVGTRHNSRWQGQPDTYFIDDFPKLLVYLFSDDYRETREWKEKNQSIQEKVKSPETKIDLVKRIWESILPHRKLLIEALKIEVRDTSSDLAPYASSRMSDGERVIFYMIGQAVSVSAGGVFIVDEPELHLHKSIQSALWDQIEAARPDCMIIYLTHDLEFAASRANATKICLRSFHPTKGFDWFVVPDETGIPEEILFKIVGSRKPILFVEGDKSSLDMSVFRHAYPKHTVVPLRSCDQVIESTKSFNGAKHLHGIEAYGVIDRDQRDPLSLEKLQGQGIFALAVSEIENVLITKDVLTALSKLLFKDPDIILKKTQKIVFEKLEHDKERIVCELATAEIERKLKYFHLKGNAEAELQISVAAHLESIDVSKIHQSFRTVVERVINEASYDEALSLYPNKGLVNEVGGQCFDMKKDGFVDLLKRAVAAGDKETLDALKKSLPNIPASN